MVRTMFKASTADISRVQSGFTVDEARRQEIEQSRLQSPVSTTGVNPGRSALYIMYTGQTRMTLSLYSKDREIENLITAHIFKKSGTLRVVD